MSERLETLDDFRRAVSDGNLIVVTDTATGTQIHRPDCRTISEATFEEKVLRNGGKNGGYFAVADERAGREFPGARLCNVCA
jgi:hypothetical protein